MQEHWRPCSWKMHLNIDVILSLDNDKMQSFRNPKLQKNALGGVRKLTCRYI